MTTAPLIIFEGPDGTGKSTISALIAELFEHEGIPCHLMTFPGREPRTLGKLVYDIHHDPSSYDIDEITPASKQTLHIAAHLDAIERLIRPTLLSGTAILLDRYWWSTWVYGIVDGVERGLLRKLVDVERISWGELLPTAAFIFRRQSPIDRNVDIHYWTLLGRRYAELAKRERHRHHVEIIDNENTISECMETVLSKLNAIIEQRHGIHFSMPKIIKGRGTASTSTSASGISVPTVFSRRPPIKTTPVFDTYWKFAVERQSIFFRRLEGAHAPWTDDPILQAHKFTNAYRASDRVSQYLIRNVIYRKDLPNTHEEVLFRILLFKIFNKIETWQLLEHAFEQVTYEDYSPSAYKRVLTRAKSSGITIYSGAYIMPTGRGKASTGSKHIMHLDLIEHIMHDNAATKLSECHRMQDAFSLLKSYPTFGNFLAYQYTTDINYSDITVFSEMEFVVPGPGARDGIRKCFSDYGGLNEAELIHHVTQCQDDEMGRLDLDFRSLWGRKLQLIDCQNLFCEVDKYSRVAHPEIQGYSGRSRIKQRFTANQQPLKVWYPPKWKLNQFLPDIGDTHDSTLFG